MDIITLANRITQARKNIADFVLKTPLIRSDFLSEMTGARVFLKLESEQYTGSFKARGSINKVLSLSLKDREKELITASTGNHALGFARAVRLTGTKGSVFLPNSASKAKVKKLQHYPVQLEFVAGDSLYTELYAKKVAQEKDAIWISPYNDYDIMAGQGTIAIELLEQLYKIDDVLITVGGGGLISGIGAYLKVNIPEVRITCCQPNNSKEMTLSLAKGMIVNQKDTAATLSDGSAGGIEPDALTFKICNQVIDHCSTVTEEEIKAALRLFIREHGKIIEGSAAVAVASLIQEKERYKDRNVIVIICGANIEISKLVEVLK